jgi:peptide/nickel transport system ATP-binding protein
MSGDYVVEVEKLRKHFPLRKGFLQTFFSKEEDTVKAVDGVSFKVGKGEILGLAGESGSGKTTTGRLLLRLVSPTEGSIVFNAVDLAKFKNSELAPLRAYLHLEGLDNAKLSEQEKKALSRGVHDSDAGKVDISKLRDSDLGLLRPYLRIRDLDITKLSDSELKPLRRDMQIIFQDPFESLDPRMTIKEIIAEPLRVQRICKNEEEVEERVKAILKDVEMYPPEEYMNRYPHELSGGQRQRIAVARAFVLDPEFVVADEPVSMLDVSIRAEVVNLMVDLVKKRESSVVFITHDLAVTKHVCDRVIILYLGKMMEMGSSVDVIDNPLHPYTAALIAAVPVPDPDYKRSDVISGEIPSPVHPPPGCRFNTRCPYAHERCTTEEPAFVEVEKGHFAACHLYS